MAATAWFLWPSSTVAESEREFDERGRQVKDDIYLLLLNGWWEGLEFVLPGVKAYSGWEQIVDTNTSEIPTGTNYLANTKFLLSPRSVSLFRLVTREANRTAAGRARVAIVDQVRRLLEKIQE